MIQTYADVLTFLQTLRTNGRTVRKAAAECKEYGADKVLGLLRQALDEEGDVLKCEALDLIAHINPDQAVVDSHRLLQSDNPEVRRAACDILGDCSSPNAEQVLLSHLNNEQSPFVRYAATSSLRWVGTHRSIPTLMRIAADDKSQDFEGRPIGELAADIIEVLSSR